MNRDQGLEVIVSGDVTIDWNLARVGHSSRSQASWVANDLEIFWQRGGAALLADLLVAVAAKVQEERSLPINVHQPAAPKPTAKITPGDAVFHHAFALWAEKEYADKPPLDKERAWRIDEFLGIRRAQARPTAAIADDTAEAAIVVLDDANMGFRDVKDGWPVALNSPGQKRLWVVYKMARPLAHGPLWEQLHRHHAVQTVLITTVDELRLTEVQISRELSWERTAQDVFWELVHNPCINALSHCAHVVVSLGTDGAILLSRQPDQTTRCFLFFDPRTIEGAWARAYPGGVTGYTTCLTAGIVRQVMLNNKRPDLPLGILNGLMAMRNLHAEGYGDRGRPLTEAPLRFPIQRVLACLAAETSQFAMVEVQDPLRFIHRPVVEGEGPVTSGFWTILEDRYQGGLDQVAEQIVLCGPEVALQGVPLGQFGNLLTVDRQETESFRSIRAVVGEYCQQARPKRPLSIAVFGAPGSGKSFGIVEVTNSLLPGRIQVQEFNLSQFASTDDLTDALHQVRDIGLTGKIPLIFWDEFDSSLDGTPLGWLRYFLAPMQDGRFQQGQISHPIGPSIFVFAGGTAARMAEFGQGLSADEYRAAKGPDFVSRLKGYVDILGPNPLRVEEGGRSRDPYFIIRRAILLRSILQRNTPELFEQGRLNIDSGVLRALLKTRVFRHGVRSIESIIMMSQLSGKSSFERSCLPSETQLDLHVDGQDFLAWVQQIELGGQVLEDLAAAAHDIYREGIKVRRDETYASSLAYGDLPEDLKEQNRQNVRDFPIKLAQAGYAMIPARSNESPFDFPGDDLEQLARMEHERWQQIKLANGWQYGPETDPDRKVNRCIVPWEELPEEEKEKDRDLVRGIPKMLARAGYAIVRTRR
jgi:hypothetical protein